MSIRVGIVGVSGYGGGEALRLCATHPTFELVYVAGEGSAGQKLIERFPGVGSLGDLVIQKWDPAALPNLDVLFASLPTGESKAGLAAVPAKTKIVDIGGDHRAAEGWTYGLADVWPDKIRGATRVANPGCYPAAALLALAPLVKGGLVDPEGLVVDAQTGVTGAGRGGASDFGYVDTSEDVFAYGLESHPHVPEMEKALAQVCGGKVTIAFTPHLVPMKRGILATCYARARGAVPAERLYEAARACYAGEPFVRIVPIEKGRSPHTRWATGSNFAFLSYAVNERTGHVIALAAIDNLGKGASAQALQNANLMTGQPETAGLAGLPLTA